MSAFFFGSIVRGSVANTVFMVALLSFCEEEHAAISSIKTHLQTWAINLFFMMTKCYVTVCKFFGSYFSSQHLSNNTPPFAVVCMFLTLLAQTLKCCQ